MHLWYFQIVYVAPMKALAAEMVRNFSRRLESLGITVKELTGDMQLTKTEIMKTQVRIFRFLNGFILINIVEPSSTYVAASVQSNFEFPSFSVVGFQI